MKTLRNTTRTAMRGIVLSPVLLAGVLIVGAVPKLQAERREGCTNATVRGSYGFYSAGTIVLNGTVLPRVTVGRETYDGNGQFSNELVINQGGTVIRTTGMGTYTVDPDCTGTIFTTVGNESLSLHFVVVDGGNQIDFIIGSSAQNLALYGVRKKQFPDKHRVWFPDEHRVWFPDEHRVCSNATLNGTYGFYSTSITDPLPRVTLGRETYDGNGNFSNTLTIVNGGVEMQTNGSGEYEVTSDCRGTLHATLGTLPLTVDFVIVDSGKEIDFVVSSTQAPLVAYGVRTKFSADQDRP